MLVANVSSHAVTYIKRLLTYPRGIDCEAVIAVRNKDEAVGIGDWDAQVELD